MSVNKDAGVGGAPDAPPRGARKNKGLCGEYSAQKRCFIRSYCMASASFTFGLVSYGFRMINTHAKLLRTFHIGNVKSNPKKWEVFEILS